MPGRHPRYVGSGDGLPTAVACRYRCIDVLFSCDFLTDLWPIKLCLFSEHRALFSEPRQYSLQENTAQESTAPLSRPILRAAMIT